MILQQTHTFLPMRQSLFYFSGTGKFCFAHGLRQLTREAKSDASCLQTLLTRGNEYIQITFGVGRRTTLIVNILFKTDFSENR